MRPKCPPVKTRSPAATEEQRGPCPRSTPMDWTLALAALVSAPCLAAAGALALWSSGRALPGRGREDLARWATRTEAPPHARTAVPSPLMLRLLAAILLAAGLLPWGLAAPPEIGRWRFVFPAFGAAFLVVFLCHGAGAWSIRQGEAFARTDRRLLAPLSLAMAAGYALLLVAWFA